VFSLRTVAAADLTLSLKSRGVLMSAVGPRSVRLVTHHDTGHEGCLKAVEILIEELAVISQPTVSSV